MNRILTYIAVACSLTFCAPTVAAETADGLLAKAVSAIKQAKSLTATAVINAQGSTSTASITSQSPAFVLHTPEVEIWYDGTTQWTLNKGAGETNITTPTAQEVAQINPLAVIANLSGEFKPQIVKASSTAEKRLHLTPKQPNPNFSSVTVDLNASTLLPSRIIVTDVNGHTTTLNITNIKTGQKLPRSTFVYNASEHPGVELVDLR